MRSRSTRPTRRIAALSAVAVAVTTPLAYGTSAAMATPTELSGEKATYIVQLKDTPIAAYEGGIRGLSATKPQTGDKVDVESSSAQAYADHLSKQRQSALKAAGIKSDRVIAEYDTVFNGMAVELTQSELAHLRKQGNVVQVWEDEVRTADTVQTPDYLGLSGEGGVWNSHFEGPENAGEGIIVGIIDTGIDPLNPSFAGDSFAPPPADWNGDCAEAGTDWYGEFECNGKIIGARWYGAEFGNTVIDGEYTSARDRNGHGSHTAGTAAGNHGVDLRIGGIPLGQASGMAPAAYLAVYKGLWQTADGNGSGTTAGLVQAIDDAVADGVDVINYSISGSSTSIVGPDEIAFFNAASAGIFVATSAGNSGDTVGESSVAHNAPWTTTVAASTHSRGAEMDVTVGGPAVERWSGKDRYATAARIADEYTAPVERVYLASGRDFADALAAAPAGAAGGFSPAAELWETSESPVLLTKQDGLPAVTADALDMLLPEEVVILGGPVAVSQDVEDQLVDAGYTVRRVFGANRYETAAELALQREGGVDTVYVATGEAGAFPDALSGGPLASVDGAPILLTRRDHVPAATREAIAELAPSNIVVLGGPVAVSEAAYAELGATERISGADRYATSAAIAARFEASVSMALVASGENFPDALSAAAFAGSRGVPVVLTKSSSLPNVVVPELERLDPALVPLAGGEIAVGTTVETTLTEMFPGEEAQTFSGVGNGSGTVGELVDAEDIPAAGFTAADSRLCLLGSVDDTAAAGKIVICTRGSNARVEKSQEVLESGGIGMIQVNNNDTESLNADFHSVPSIHLTGTDGAAVKAYEDSSARPVARISDQSTDPVNAPEMAGFSSYGPALAGGGDLLKPDITAPGVDIAAAYHGDWDDPGTPTFDQISGTSMSSPHIAGLGALMKQEFPDWSPAAIKSAMMTTARDTDDNGGPIQRAGSDASPLDYGAGEVRPGASYNPGLVYDSDWIDWLDYLCVVAPSAVNGCTGEEPDASDLNYPSISIGDLSGSQTVTRTVTDVTGVGGTYTVEVEAPEGTTVSVSPQVLEVPANGTATYEVTITVTTATPGEYTFGQLRLVNGDIVVESPIAVKPVFLSAPAEVYGEGVEGSADLPITPAFDGELDLQVSGLVASDVTPAEVVSDGPGGGQFLDDGWEVFVVPAGTQTLKVAIFDDEISVPGTDMDIYLVNSAYQIVAESATSGSDEFVVVENPTPGVYALAIDYYDGAAGASAVVPMHVWALDGTDAGNLTVDPASTSTVFGETIDATLTWSGLAPASRYLGAVSYVSGGEELGRTIVNVLTGAPAAS